MMKKVIDGQVVRFTFDDNVPAFEFDCASLSAANREYAVPFGMCHRLGDAAAIAKSAENGFRITEQMRRDAITDLAEHYASGSDQWNVKVATRAVSKNPGWMKLAELRGVPYEIVAKEKNDAILAEIAALSA